MLAPEGRDPGCARIHFERAVEMDPHNPVAWEQLQKLAVRERDMMYATFCLERRAENTDSARAKANLLAERTAHAYVVVTGNTVIDAFLATERRVREGANSSKIMGTPPKTSGRRHRSRTRLSVPASRGQITAPITGASQRPKLVTGLPVAPSTQNKRN